MCKVHLGDEVEAHTVHSLLICQNEKRLDIKKKTRIHTLSDCFPGGSGKGQR